MKKGEEGWIIAFILALSILVIPMIAEKRYPLIMLPTLCGAIALIITITLIIFIINRK
jgi:hypothetical protein